MNNSSIVENTNEVFGSSENDAIPDGNDSIPAPTMMIMIMMMIMVMMVMMIMMMMMMMIMMMMMMTMIMMIIMVIMMMMIMMMLVPSISLARLKLDDSILASPCGIKPCSCFLSLAAMIVPSLMLLALDDDDDDDDLMILLSLDDVNCISQ